MNSSFSNFKFLILYLFSHCKGPVDNVLSGPSNTRVSTPASSVVPDEMSQDIVVKCPCQVNEVSKKIKKKVSCVQLMTHYNLAHVILWQKYF